MSRFLLLALAVSGAHAVRKLQMSPPANISYDAMLEDLWVQTDTDADGVLSVTEFSSAADKLGITVGMSCSPPCTLTEHASVEAFYAALDTGGDGLSKTDLAAAITEYPNYQEPLIAAFTNGAGQVPTDVNSLMPPLEAITSTATVKVSMVVSGSPSAIYPGTRTAIKEYFAASCGVDPANVVLTFIETVARRSLHARAKHELRKLQTTSTTVEATIFVPDDVAATAAQANLEADIAAGVDTVPAFSGLTIESVAPVSAAVRVPPIDTGSITACAFGLILVVPIFLCVFATCYAKKNTANMPAEPAGCCSNGCCSFNAVGPWASGEFMASCFILGFMFMLYVNMESVVLNIVGLVETFNALVASNITLLGDFTSTIPQSVIVTLRDNVGQFSNLNVAVTVPGVLAALALMLGAICPILPLHKGSYCWTKLFILLSKLFLLIAFVFYIIMAAVTATLAYGPPEIQLQISLLRGACVTVPAQATQMVTDNAAALSQLEAAGQDTSEFAAILVEVDTLVTLIDAACGHMEGFFLAIFDTFLPCMCCILAIVYAFFVNQTLCCAAGCCKGPPTEAEAPAGKAPTMTGVENVKEVEVTVQP